jgi:predicted amidohydrolase
MTRIVTLSALQPPLAGPDTPDALRAHRLDMLRDQVRVARQRDSHLVLLPEVFNSFGLPRDVALEDGADRLDGAFVTAARELAAGHEIAIVLPIDACIDGKIWNCAVVIDARGNIAGIYRKVHPTRSELARGRSAGSEFPVFEVIVRGDQVIRVGVQICHDNSFVESARCLALAGAEVICWPHVQSGWGDVVWDITLRSRAIDNGIWLLSSCFAVRGDAAWRPGMMVGRSGLVAPDGTILTDAGRDAGVATATIDLDQPRLVHSWSVDEDLPFVDELRKDRRPDAYQAITSENRMPGA